MTEFSKSIEIRWSDCDMNRHVRHTAYGDFGAHLRIAFFAEHGLTAEKFNELGVGPVLTHEELHYLREVGPHQSVMVNVALSGLSEDGTLWRFRHEVFRQDGKLAATIEASGVWIDLKARKKTIPPLQAQAAVSALPKSKDFQILTIPNPKR